MMKLKNKKINSLVLSTMLTSSKSTKFSEKIDVGLLLLLTEFEFFL